MIAQTPVALIVLLLMITILALVAGYCIALLRTKHRVRQIIDDAQGEIEHDNGMAEAKLQLAISDMTALKSTLGRKADQVRLLKDREKALDNHNQLQAQRIRTLEAQCAAFEEQQIRLQRDFATYKSNKHLELEVARHSQEGLGKDDEPPLLSKKSTSTIEQSEEKLSQSFFKRDGGSRSSAGRVKPGLSTPLSRELDIPTLSESELPDSVDDLEFEMSEGDKSGVLDRG